MTDPHIESTDYILHVTCIINQPKPHDKFSVILPVPGHLVEETPAPLLVNTDAIGSLIKEAVERGIIRDVFGMEPHEYHRKVRRSEEVPKMPMWEVLGFALMTPAHVEASAWAYRQVAQVYGLGERGER